MKNNSDSKYLDNIIKLRPGYSITKFRQKYGRHYNAYHKLKKNVWELHRIDGPALEYIDSDMTDNNMYYLNGAPLTKKESEELIEYNKMTTEQLLYHIDNYFVRIILEERFSIEAENTL